jgi:hypothetical protein
LLSHDIDTDARFGLVFLQAVCNRFDADFVRSQWTHAAELWRTHLLHALGPLIGHASDGDARRRKLQLEDYRAQGSGERGSRYYLPAPGFLFSAWQQGTQHQVKKALCVDFSGLAYV